MTVSCRSRPSQTLRPELGQGTRWRLISHLTLHGLSLRDFESGAEGLREILRLYDPINSISTADAIDGLQSVTVERGTGKIAEIIEGRRHEYVCRGLNVELMFDDSKFTSGEMYLFASVLDRFLGLYCSINSFVRTTAITTNSGVLHKWPRRAGDRVLL